MTERTVPPWAFAAARAIPLLALPVCLWRLPYAFGYDMGSTQELGPWQWWMIPYVFGLSVLSEVFCLLCSGLVRPWGETVPAWVPGLGGRRIPPAVVLVPSTLAALGLTWLFVDWLRSFLRIGDYVRPPYDDGWYELAMTVSGLFSLIGPLLLALTFAYYRRRCLPGAYGGGPGRPARQQ
ncbi:hypothetical protein ACH44C_14065 [Streptomyces purpureus]|uniref:hypothetical protein n=1 Tax=Streptomyces purpureus TaxID=1951 RepID=UPI0037905E64